MTQREKEIGVKTIIRIDIEKGKPRAIQQVYCRWFQKLASNWEVQSTVCKV